MSEHFDIIPLVQSSMSEREWLLRMLAPLDFTLHEYEEHPKIMPGALYLYNNVNRIDLSDAFLSGVRQAGHCGLIHLGDEYYRAIPKDYQAFDYVVRMFPFQGIMGEGIFPLPLGMSNNMNASLPLSASQREHTWMFAGDWKADRGAMARHFRHVPNGYLSLPKSAFGERGVSREAYLQNMSNAVFAPCPAGNVCVETCRPYEALEMGAIPLLPGRWFSNAFDDVLGSHPLPIFANWQKAAEFVREKIEIPNEIDDLQSLCQEWWEDFQARTSDEFSHFLESGRQGDHRAALQWHLSRTTVSAGQRFIALLAQQNKSQLTQRGKFNVYRLLRALGGKGHLTGTWSIGSANGPTALATSDAQNRLGLSNREKRHPSQ